jgi:hypothetical protein
MMWAMKIWTATPLSRRLYLFSALLLLGAIQGCSCDSGEGAPVGDVGLDGAMVSDSGDLRDAAGARDVFVDTSTSSDAKSDTVGDAEAGLDAHSDADSDVDTGPSDADPNAEPDAGADAGDDTGSGTDADTGSGTDADVGVALGDCVSGATGTHALRFGWEGSGPNSTAYVDYEVNELPDTSRWKVGAYSRSFSYSPVYTDTFLGEGGLDLSGTVFIDVELSTDGLGALNNVTLAVYGRSFNTTSSGSFEWQTFSGVGASGLVANSAPYQWYQADATAALPAGDAGILLRIEAGPSSNSLVVNRVEICFDQV